MVRTRITGANDKNECCGKVAKTSTTSVNDGKMGRTQTNDSIASTCIMRANDSMASTLCGKDGRTTRWRVCSMARTNMIRTNDIAQRG